VTKAEMATGTLFTVTATAGGTVAYTYATNPGTIGTDPIVDGVITLALPLDFEGTNPLVFEIV